MALLLLFISLMLLCIAASLPAPTSMRNPYSHPHPPPDSERMVEEDKFMVESSRSMDAHEQRDVAALLSFKSCITYDPLGKLSNWTAHNSHNICSSWYGIHCRPHTNRVVSIDLHAHAHAHASEYVVGATEFEGELEGSLSSSLSSLSLLHSLNLSGNYLTGRIPAEFGHLKSLRALDLSFNFFLNGSIPAELGRLQKLRSLDLSDNSLTGRIPAELGSLQQLRSLDLSGNRLTGRIPAELGSLQQLEYLLLEDNDFSGTIPHWLGYLSAKMVEHLSALRTRIVAMAAAEGPATRNKRKTAMQHGGSTLADLLQALDDYLPVLLGLTKGSQLQDLVEFVWINQEDDEQETAISSAWYEVLSVLHMMSMLSLSQANSLLIPTSSVDGYQPKVTEENKKAAINIFLKAAGYLDCAVRSVLPQMREEVKSELIEDS